MLSFIARLLWEEGFELSHRILNTVLFSFAIFASVAVIANYFTNESSLVQGFAIFLLSISQSPFIFHGLKKNGD